MNQLPNLAGWDKLPPAPESLPGQLDLIDTGRGLAKRQRADHAGGQDFLFELRADHGAGCWCPQCHKPVSEGGAQ